MDPGGWEESQPQHYLPYPHLFPNPSPFPAPALGSAPSSSHVFDSHSVGAAVAPPGVDAQAPIPYAPHGGYESHAVSYVYPTAGVGPFYNGGGDAQGVAANNACRQYAVPPVAHGDVLGIFPTVLIYKNRKAAQPSLNGIKWNKTPKTVQSVYCEVCKIACNSQEVLNSHRQGKKHKKNLEKLKESVAPNPANGPIKLVKNKETPQSVKDKIGGEKAKKKPSEATDVDLETKRKKVLEGGAAADAVKVCALCNVVCNSEVVFSYHIGGQKHVAMVKKQQGASVS